MSLIFEQGFQEKNFYHIGYPGIENLILPMLSYPERQVTSSCEIAS